MLKILLFTIVNLLAFQTAFAVSGYERLNSCGSAKVVSGDTCSNVKVELDLTGCQLKIPTAMATQIVCEGTKIKARYQNDQYRYEAGFDKKSDGWGGVTWDSLGQVHQWKKSGAVAFRQDLAPAQKAPAENRFPADIGSAVKNLKFGAFFDFRYSAFEANKDPEVSDDRAQSGFGLEDGAIYANYENGKLAAVADLAFRRGYDKDTGVNSTTSQSNDSSFRFGVDKSQLYLKYKAAENLTLDFGQFDTIFGVEVNDSKDRVFNKTGLVYDYLMPVTHTGAMLEYSMQSITAKAFAANPNNKGTNGTSAAGDENSEYGAAVSYASDAYHGQVGYMSRSINKAGSDIKGDRSLIDVTAGTSMGALSVDLEYSSVRDQNKNGLTADTTDTEDPATGIFALVSYKFSDALMLGVRYESLSNFIYGAATAVDKVDSYGLSLRSKVSADLELRAEYIGYSFTPIAGTDWDDRRFSFASLVTF